jgi:hypothetical protein
MSSIKCQACGLVNYAGVSACRRCGRPIEPQIHNDPATPTPRKRRRYFRSTVRIIGLAGFIVFLWYASLVGSSEPVLFEQRQTLDRAIDVLERQGFNTEVTLLRHLVYFRSTDNWWNRRVGHASAYAATNFPFEIITLYPPFFDQPIDDVERAAILLHEAYHLKGGGEESAFERTWRDRARLGWIKEKYAGTPVWSIVKDSTRRYVPALFTCGPEHLSDCTEVTRQ